ncbi:thioesterase family protein [Thalassobacillus pellis]|uniref:thioesterase family protein n=1 Tax=Thalassobacillus pellis TaxID=748008 RepID=UPI0019613817|nr:thioesterase [Thalassobacillus pellis]MBM7554293.1 putative thioesterase [Thalassobacillus pellis]
MKEGMEKGQTQTMTIEVTSEMFAQFGGDVVHRTFSTVSMVYYMEWVSRKIILPYLENNEEGMGGAVTVKHVNPAPEGAHITITATLTEKKRNVVITKVEAVMEELLIGTGEVKQVILPKAKIKEMLMEDSMR